MWTKKPANIHKIYLISQTYIITQHLFLYPRERRGIYVIVLLVLVLLLLQGLIARAVHHIRWRYFRFAAALMTGVAKWDMMAAAKNVTKVVFTCYGHVLLDATSATTHGRVAAILVWILMIGWEHANVSGVVVDGCCLAGLSWWLAGGHATEHRRPQLLPAVGRHRRHPRGHMTV